MALGRSVPVCQIWATSKPKEGPMSAMNKPNKAELAQIWATLVLILAQIWAGSNTLLRPAYCVEWWHLGGPLLFARFGPQVSLSIAAFTVSQPNKPKLAPMRAKVDFYSNPGLPHISHVAHMLHGMVAFWQWSTSRPLHSHILANNEPNKHKYTLSGPH